MPDFPNRNDGSLTANFGAATADSRGVTLTSGAANVKGNWAQLIASTPFPVTGLHVYRMTASFTASGWDGLMDIGVGSTPVVKISNIPYVSTDTVNYPGHHYYFPIAIREGEEVSARFQESAGVETMDIFCIAESRGFKSSGGYSLSRTYGDNTTDSGGQIVDPGDTDANTKGGSTEMVASTEFHIHNLCVFQHAADGNGGLTDAAFLMDIEVGASSNEVAIIENMGFLADGSPDAMSPIFLGSFNVDIPAGTRISANAQSDIIAADRLIDVILVAFG